MYRLSRHNFSARTVSLSHNRRCLTPRQQTPQVSRLPSLLSQNRTLFTKPRLLRLPPLQAMRKFSTASSPIVTPGQHNRDLFNPHDYEDRKAFVNELSQRSNGAIYPPFRQTITIAEYKERYKSLNVGEKRKEEEHVLAGRIYNVREASKKLFFYVIRSENHAVQVLASLGDTENPEEFQFLTRRLRRGDIIAVKGYPYNSKTGELSICAKSIQVLAPCLHELPDYNQMSDKELRYRHRHVDLLVNKGIKDIFVTRANIISTLRQFLNNRGFVEVETPVLQKHAGGAVAKPFHTHLHAHHQDLVLRIAPELYLKQLIVGGMDKVYEIGKNFRNEGIDNTHNPEFTTCEFYQAYADYEELMQMTEDLIRRIVQSVHGTLQVEVDIPRRKGSNETEHVVIDFSKPFRRISLNEELEKIIGEPLPDVNDPKSAPQFMELCKKFQLEVSQPTSVKMYDTLVEHFLESQCVQPTFLIHFPLAMSPLARQHRSMPNVTERFELYIGRMEVCNAYTELNDPEEQRRRFEQQVALGESLGFNEEWFCNVLEWGMPPTAGWGMGIDRLTMILTNRFSIKEVMLFPFLKEKDTQ